MAWLAVGRVSVVVHAGVDPADAEWDAYLDDMRRFPRLRELRVLTYSSGGGPSGPQRQKLQRQAGKHPPPVSIMTAKSMRMRGIGTALRWFNGDVAVFDEEDLKGACEHLGLSRWESAEVRSALERLKAQVSPPKTGTE